MPFLFGKSSDDSVGVDIGTSAVKIVHLTATKEGNYTFQNFAIARLKKGALQSADQIIASQRISNILSTALQKSQIKARSVSFAIPSFSSFISFISIPKTSEEELPSKLEIEARKYIPIPLSEVSLGWEIINDYDKGKSMGVDKSEERMKILLMAVSNDTIHKYESIAETARLNLGSIEVESFSLVRSLGRGYEGTSLILDVGSRVCNILIIADGFLRGSRNIDIGGGDISEAVSRSLNIDYARSESLKKELGVGDKQLSSVISPIISRISQETKRMLDAYNSKNPGKKVKRVVLSGGTSKLRGFPQLLREELALPIEEGNPWRHVHYPQKYEPILKSFKNELAVAVGIAMNK